MSRTAKTTSRISTDGSVFCRYYILSCGVIFAVTGVGKILSAIGKARVLGTSDPLFGTSFSHLMSFVGSIEVILSLLCLSVFLRFRKIGLLIIASLSTNFLIYRVGLWLIDWQRPCSCMGNLTDALHISPETADTVMKVVLAYLLIGSYAIFFWIWRQKRKASLALSSPPRPISGGQTALQ